MVTPILHPHRRDAIPCFKGVNLSALFPDSFLFLQEKFAQVVQRFERLRTRQKETMSSPMLVKERVKVSKRFSIIGVL